MQRRAFERIPTKLQARLFYGNAVYPGVIMNLSENGMFISTKMSLTHDSVLEVVMLLSGEVLKVPVNVRRTVITDDPNDHKKINGVGVELLDLPSDYLEFVNNLKFAV